jgi:ferredoxin/flavodoxin
VDNKNRGVILYHSGAGSAKLIAELIHQKISKYFDVDISHFDSHFNNSVLEKYSFIVFGFPTHHAAPSLSMKEFVVSLDRFNKPKKSFIYTTYGLYPGNSLRIFAKHLHEKNIKVMAYEEFKSPASDGVLLFPEYIKFMFRFESSIQSKVNAFADSILSFENLEKDLTPRYKWYVPLNDIIKSFGEKQYENYKKKMHVITELCTNCNLCVKGCERCAWVEHPEGPVFVVDNCEFCLECVHKCPTRAIVFSEGMKDKPRLDKRFFAKLGKELMQGNV